MTLYRHSPLCASIISEFSEERIFSETLSAQNRQKNKNILPEKQYSNMGK